MSCFIIYRLFMTLIISYLELLKLLNSENLNYAPLRFCYVSERRKRIMYFLLPDLIWVSYRVLYGKGEWCKL